MRTDVTSETEPLDVAAADSSKASSYDEPPRFRLSEAVAESRISAVIVCTVGLGALALTTVGTGVLFATGGMSHHTLVAATLTSSELRVLEWLALGLGLSAFVTGCLVYRRLDTRMARSEAETGLIAGLGAAGIAVGILAFTRGDMETFAQNFLDFSSVTPLWSDFVEGMKNTVILATGSAVGGIAIGLAFSLLAISSRAILRAPYRIYVNVIRGTPLLLLLAVIYFGLALGLGINVSPFTAVIIGLAINAGAYVAEIFRAGLQSIERGQLDAARGLGLSYLKSLRFIIIPQAFRRVIPPLMNTYIGLVKDTSLIAFLGVTLDQRELFTVASQGYAQYFNATFYLASALGYLAITIPLIVVVNALEKRLRSGLVAVGV